MCVRPSVDDTRKLDRALMLLYIAMRIPDRKDDPTIHPLPCNIVDRAPKGAKRLGTLPAYLQHVHVCVQRLRELGLMELADMIIKGEVGDAYQGVHQGPLGIGAEWEVFVPHQH